MGSPAAAHRAQARGTRDQSQAHTPVVPGRRACGPAEKRKRVAVARVMKPVISGRNERWSMDFVCDTLADGRVFRAFTLVDDFTRECPVIEINTSLAGERITRVLDGLALIRGLPECIVCDNGPVLAGQVLDQWLMSAASLCISSSPGSRCRMRMLRASTASSETSA